MQSHSLSGYIVMSKKRPDTNVVQFERKPVATAVKQGIETSVLNQIKEESKQTWEDLYGIYYSIAQTIIESGNSINTLINANHVKPEILGNNELTIAINGFGNDLKTFSDQLAKIYDQHKHRTGIIEEEDFNLSIKVFEEYKQTAVELQSIIMPNIVYITSEIGHIADRLLKASKDETTETQGDIA